MKMFREVLAFPFVLLALSGVAFTLFGMMLMTLFAAIANVIEGKK